jgi:hypothetical protein
MQNQTNSSRRSRLLTAAASLAIAGAIGFGAATSGALPSYAEAVRVEGTQAVGFADVVLRCRQAQPGHLVAHLPGALAKRADVNGAPHVLNLLHPLTAR